MDDPSRPVDFVWLNGHAIRVTSWRGSDDPGTFAMVAITRGSRDAERLDELLGQDHLTLRLEDHPPMAVTVNEVERREFGLGQGAVTRFAVAFSSGERLPDASNGPISLDDRVTALEAEVARLRTELRELANRFRPE